MLIEHKVWEDIGESCTYLIENLKERHQVGDQELAECVILN